MGNYLDKASVTKLVMVAAAAILAILGTKFPDAQRVLDGLAGGLTGGALIRSPGDLKKGAEGALMLLLVCVGLSGCTGPARAPTPLLDLAVLADKAGAELEQAIAQLRAEQHAVCDVEASTEMDRTICHITIDHVWTKAQMAIDHLRAGQKEKLLALGPADFLQWFHDAYCDVRANAPPELILPPVPGLACEVPQ